MSKSTYHVKETKNGYKLSFTGDLKEATEKARKDLQKEEDNQEIAYWDWIRKKAERAVLVHSKKIEKIKVFIRAAEREMEKAKADKGNA
ncbi:MAG: hypothetical protein HDQ99_14755 [Lachnospiraceae bacterium]|nr:hypothetical protein [Lachnospiraceae bacterium]